MEFTALEKKMLLGFLQELRNHQSNAVCNDFELPNTPEGQKIHEESVRLTMSKRDADEWLSNDHGSKSKTIATMDSIVLRYLSEKIKKVL